MSENDENQEQYENKENNDSPKFSLKSESKEVLKQPLRKFWLWLTDSKQRIFSIFFLFSYITVLITLGILNKDPTRIMLDIVFWFQNKTENIGLYLGVGVISTFGNFLMFIPSMYAFVLMFIAVLDVNPLLLGIAAGIGASIGQITSWFVGRATREIVDDKMIKRLKKTQRLIERGLAPLLIFFFAATPLPDEVLLITIGLVNYSLWKTLLFCFIGKIALTVAISVIANVISQTNFGEWLLLTLFNVTREDLLAQSLPESGNTWTSIIIWIISGTLIIVVALVDWVSIFDKRRCKKEQKMITQLITLANKTNLKHDFIVYSQITDDKCDYFPDESLWFFEEKIESKKEVYIRKSLLSIEAISSCEIDVQLTSEWLTDFRRNLTLNKFGKYQINNLSIIKHPTKIYDKGLFLLNSKYLSFKTKIKTLLGSDAITFIKTSRDLNRLEKKRLLRRKMVIEILIEATPENSAKVWAIGLKEGVYLQKIATQLNPKIVLINWLGLLDGLVKSPFDIKELMIYDLKEAAIERLIKEQTIETLSECPI